MKLSTKLAAGAAGLGLVAGAPLVYATSGYDRGYDRGSHYELQIVGLTDDRHPGRRAGRDVRRHADGPPRQRPGPQGGRPPQRAG